MNVVHGWMQLIYKNYTHINSTHGWNSCTGELTAIKQS